MSKFPVILVGGGGHGRVIADMLSLLGLRVHACYDSEPNGRKEFVEGVPLYAYELLDAVEREKFRFCISVGDNSSRHEQACALSERGFKFSEPLIHPSAYVSPQAHIGEGSVVMAGAVVQSHARIGRHVIVNTSATIDHDCEIGDYSHVAPGCNLCGGVKLGERSIVGVASACAPYVKIGSDVVIGGKSFVLHDMPDKVTAWGVPATVVEK